MIVIFHYNRQLHYFLRIVDLKPLGKVIVQVGNLIHSS